MVLTVVLAGAFAVVRNGAGQLWALLRSSQAEDFMTGSLATKIDRVIFDAMPRSSVLDGAVAGFLYRALHDAGPQVRAGCGDWLYSIEELQDDRHAPERIASRVLLLQHFTRFAAERGVLLVILPIPDKVQQVGTELCGLPTDVSRRRTELWRQATRTMGLDFVDLTSGWPRPGYWRTDTHWDNAGARFAAERVAKYVIEKLGPGSQKFQNVSVDWRPRRGDLARLSGLADAPGWLAPAPEYEELIESRIARSGTLLDEASVPSVVLAGSSFSMNSGFADYLQVLMSREVANVSEPGGGFAGALLKFMRGANDLSGVKAVVWEWPMRSLSGPLSETERELLQSLKGAS